ncbi:uncharacterized protein [Rutidosis leptorrhynchoides]|uniref:uncharacterized protein n=1 Tax=Rutidosis leptorrhynchoides TaxID=125765 RepID=UPI003A99CD81
MELHAQLRDLSIGNQTIEEYLRNIDRITTHLRNLGSNVEDHDLVLHTVNGLRNKFPHVTHIILHREPFPKYDTIRSMLWMEEMTLNSHERLTSDAQLNASHPTALVVQPPPKQPSNL